MPDGNGRIPLETSGADIEGRTSAEKILAAACDWVEPGTEIGDIVFPGSMDADEEIPGMLGSLFSA